MSVASILASAALAAAFSVETEPIGPRGAVDPLDGKCPWRVRLAGVEGDFECSVLDMEGALVAGPFVTSDFPVPAPKIWSAETPDCYRLSLRQGETVSERVFGFCTREITDRRLVVNGRAVRVKFAPRALNGNAEFASRISEADAFAAGVYRLTGREAAMVVHEAGSDNFGATRHALQDWLVTPTNYFERLVVANMNTFVDSTGVMLRWTLLVDGEISDDGELELRAIGPGQSAVYDMPREAVAARYGDGTVSVRFEFLKDGEVIATDQADLVESRAASPLYGCGGWFSPGPVAFEGKGEVRRFTAGGALFGGTVFSYGGVPGSALPIAFSRLGVFGREPLITDGALAISGLEPCRAYVLPLSPVDERLGALSFTTRTELNRDGGAAPVSSVDAVWTVCPNGVVACSARFVRAPDEKGTCRTGYTFELPCRTASSWWRLDWSQPLPGENLEVEWFGLGPWSTTPTDTAGAFLGRWRTTAASALSAEKVRGVRVGDLTVRTLGAPFAFRLAERPAGTLRDASASSIFLLTLYGDPGPDGTVDLAFTLSQGDSDLTARSPAFQ